MSIALRRGLAPVMHILEAPETEDLAIQEPGVGWWLHHGAWHRVELPAMTYARLYGISVMAAAQTRKTITPRNPILDADILDDLRLISVMPPAVLPGTMALTFRRGDLAIDEVSEVSKMFNTSRWNKWSTRRERKQAQDAALLECMDSGDLEGFLQGLADTRKTGIFIGPTGAGKTRISKMLGGAISALERIIAVEDARELVIRQPNHVRHFYSSSSRAETSQASILRATLRERPDRVMLAEMRDRESATLFLEKICAGHPGSISTLHCRDAPEAAWRLLTLLGGNQGSSSEEEDMLASQLGSSIDFIIPIENDGGVRSIGEVWFRPDAARRGETFRDLLKQS